MTLVKKKETLLAALGLLWGAVVWWQWGAYQEPVRVPLTNVSGPPSSGREQSGGLRVNVGLLEAARHQREATFTMPRNIFAVPRADGTLPMANGAAATEPVSAQALAQRASALELEQYRYLGFLRLGDRQRRAKDVAVLSKNEEVVVVKVGERVEEHLVLKAITPESVTIRDIGARVDHTLPLSEEPAQQ